MACRKSFLWMLDLLAVTVGIAIAAPFVLIALAPFIGLL